MMMIMIIKIITIIIIYLFIWLEVGKSLPIRRIEDRESLRYKKLLHKHFALALDHEPRRPTGQ